jgi:hypothetical protein
MSISHSVYAVDASTPLGAAGETISLVQGGTFVVCAPDGSISKGGMQGYFAADTRVLSELRVTINGQRPLVLEESVRDGEVAVVGAIGDPTRPDLLVTKVLDLDSGHLRMVLTIRNLEPQAAVVIVDASVAADFADIFDVKRGEIPRGGFVGAGATEGSLVLAYENGSFRRGLRITTDHPAEILRDGLRISEHLDGGAESKVEIDFMPETQRHVTVVPTTPATTPMVLDHASVHLPSHPGVIEASCSDLESLIIQDPTDGERWVMAAGSPWFLTLFGRDSLITSMQAMPLTTTLGMNVLHSLAARQGVKREASTEEEPGRILHEIRAGEAVTRDEGWGSIYYGTVDASPLFIMTLAEAVRWGADLSEARGLMPAAEAAAEWMLSSGDPDQDGFIEYPGRASRTGLDNQAWKDSYDAVRHADGTLAEGPIAMVEVQGYAHAALRDLADLREVLGTAAPEPLRRRAATLRDRIHDRFWMDSENCFALALDGRKQQVASVATNAGHLLWTGTVHSEVAERLTDRLMEPDMFTGFGLRTLSSRNQGWNPLSYHCGTVWPHDSAIVAAGMFIYGLTDQASRLSRALLDAAACCSGRLPELFAGFDRSEFPRPVPYPSSCSPQAWSAGAPLMIARHLLGLRPPVNISGEQSKTSL